MSEGIGLETFELLDDIMMKSLYDNIIGKDRNLNFVINKKFLKLFFIFINYFKSKTMVF